MNKPPLPGIPQQPDPSAGIALPLMRGFPCPTAAPFMGGQEGPQSGVGVGWSNVVGHGPVFFVTIHAEGGFALAAQMDYARYKRFAENWASIGKQAMLNGDLADVSDSDPLAALAVAHEAMGAAAYDLDPNAPSCAELRDAIRIVAKALMLEPQEDQHD